MNHASHAPDAQAQPDVRRNLRHLAGDVVTLLELQVELLKVDVKEWARGMVLPGILAVFAVVSALAAMPVFLFGLAYLLREKTELTLWAALLIASGVGIGLAIALILTAVLLLKRDVKVLGRSAAELSRNVRWLKEVLTNPTPATAE